MSDSKLIHRLSLACLTVLALGSNACGDDGKAEAGDAAGTSGTAESGDSSAEAPETGSATMGDGDGDGDGGDGDGDGDGGDGDGDGDAGDGDGDGAGDGDGDGAGDGDGDAGPCPNYETQDECTADPACMALMGQPLQENGPDAPCLQPLEYAGCIAMMGCGDALTWFCTGGNSKPILMSSTCGPAGADMCDPGVQDPPECP
jgi:hypothetical protein